MPSEQLLVGGTFWDELRVRNSEKSIGLPSVSWAGPPVIVLSSRARNVVASWARMMNGPPRYETLSPAPSVCDGYCGNTLDFELVLNVVT